MEIALALALFVLGLALVVGSAEKVVDGALGTAIGFGISAFLVSVVFLGFDPENLAVGAVGAYEDVPGFALGSIVGAAMVAVALAFGVTALLAPMSFETAPDAILGVPLVAGALLAGLSLDGELGRLDGALLLGGFAAAIAYLLWLSRRGVDVTAQGAEGAEGADDARSGRWRSLALLLVALAGVVLGSELLVQGGERLVAWFGLDDTWFGMTVLALAVSVEELGRELPAALRGRPDITVGNVVGSVLAFFLFNAGVIALVRPLPVSDSVRLLYLPLALITVVVALFFLRRRRVGRRHGAVLVGLYAAFAIGAWFAPG